VRSAVHTIALIGIGVSGLWLALLCRHEEEIRRIMRSQCLHYGVDWEWANPSDTGQPILASVPWTRDLYSGEITQWPLMVGRRRKSA
jgi:hypothetical protein